MASNTHDPATVERVATAIGETVFESPGAMMERLSSEEAAVAALTTLTELGWRPGFTEQERNEITRVYDALLSGTSHEIASQTCDAQDTIRALLAGGRHG